MPVKLIDLWSLFGLRENPFFQETLAPGSPYPTDLFVGRDRETVQILRAIGSSPSSRQVVHGPPGVGKTTLAQHAKHELAELGHIIRWRPVSLTAAHTATGLIIDVLASIHEAMLTALPRASDEEPMEASRGLVRAFRQSTISGGITILGTGIEGGHEASYSRPVDAGMLQEAWRLILDLTRLASEKYGRSGVVVHLNNLENLTSKADLETAALVVRDPRDIFLVPGLHWIIVGTTEATQAALGEYEQVRSIFLPSSPALKSLPSPHFVALLRKRYQHLRAGTKRVLPPVSDRAAERVYDLLRGDLRGALRTLEQGCLALGGLTEGEPVRSLEYEELTTVLQPGYRAEMAAELPETAIGRMQDIAELRGDGATQKQLEKVWGVSRQRVSTILADLEHRGYLRRIGTRDRSRLYALTGTGLIALGATQG